MPENNITKPFNEKLVDLLKTDLRFVDDEGELIKAAVIDRAWKIDRDLVKLLLSEPEIEKKFFDEIEGRWIFNINTFIEYISDKNFLANSYTRFRNKIGLNIGGKFLRERGEVSLVWPYKDCVLEGGQTKEEEKRKEIFFNEILAQDEIDRLFDPKVLTNFKRYTPDGEQRVTEIKRDEDGTIKENLIIKGNNLLALHTLKTQFRGKVKLIYIDPPYNTGNDSFGYNDAFSRSTWLTFMKNRIEIARELLSQDGAIVVQISDRHVGYLQVLMDEIFPEGFINKVAVKTRSPSGFKTVNLGVFESAEYLLIYGRNRKLWKYNPQFEVSKYDENYSFQVTNIDESFSKWKIVNIKEVVASEHGFADVRKAKKELGETVFLAELAQYALQSANSVFRFTEINRDAGKDTLALKAISIKKPDKVLMLERENLSPRYILNGKEITFYTNKVRKLDGILAPTTMLTNIWTDIPWEGIASEGKVKLKKGKKPERLLRRLIEMGTDNPNDIVLDFYLGSGTTAAVAHKMGRQYIGVEQLDYGKNDSVIRLQNVIGKRKKDSLIEEYKDYDKSVISKAVNWQGGGDFIYCELMKYNEAFMDKIQSAKTSDELLEIWKDIAKNSFLNWYVNPEMPKEAVNNFIEIGRFENGLEKQKKLLAELLNKNQLYINLSEIDDEDFKVSEEDKKMNQSFYGEAYNG